MDHQLVHDLAGELLKARQHVMALGNPERTAGEMADAKRTAIAILKAGLPRLRRCPATPETIGFQPHRPEH